MLKKWKILPVFLMLLCMLTGCEMLSMERVKLRDLEFVILSEEVLPAELKTIIDERKAEPFKLTYADADALYICVGYGEQESGGYSITVDELYLTDTAIYVETTLLGPDGSQTAKKAPSYPYIVIKTEPLEQNVICEQETENKALREELEHYRSTNRVGHKQHDAAWTASYNDFVLKYESGMTIMEIVSQGEISRRTAYRYKAYYDEMQAIKKN